MAELNVMPFYTDAYLADTTHLSTEEHGAYCLLLIAMWRAGGRLSADPAFLQRVARVSPKRWPRLWSVVGTFFLTDGDYIVQKRLREVYRTASARKEMSRANGKRGGRPGGVPKPLKLLDVDKPTGFARDNLTESESKPRRKLSTSHEPTSHEPVAAAAATDSSKPRAHERAEIERIENLLREAAGLENDPSPGLLVIGPILGLIDSGYDLEADILPAIRAVRKRGNKGRSWNYYVQAIVDAKGDRSRASSNGAATPSEPAEVVWRRKYQCWVRTKSWPATWGPPPDSAGCEIPDELISRWSDESADKSEERR
jgi:uncharacterized protein YdaU (DUF1376 family)